MEYQKITKVSKNSQHNNSETATNENNEKYLKKCLAKDIYLQKEGKKSLIILILM